jgi:hypothetical protein
MGSAQVQGSGKAGNRRRLSRGDRALVIMSLVVGLLSLVSSAIVAALVVFVIVDLEPILVSPLRA